MTTESENEKLELRRLGKMDNSRWWWLEPTSMPCANGRIGEETGEETFDCNMCNRPLERHFSLTAEDIEALEEAEITYTICGKRYLYIGSATAKISRYAWVNEPPEDPCDEDFMEEISTRTMTSS